MFPFVAVPGVETIDLTDIVANPNNVLLMAEGGGILFCRDEPSIYQVHTNFLPGHRGRYAIRASLSAYHWMFTHTECMTLNTMIPAFNKAAAAAAKIVGFVPQFERKNIWPIASGHVDMQYLAIGYADWIRKASSNLIAAGKTFHRRLDEEYVRLGRPAHSHPDEDCHDLYVGACAETVYGGQLDKAVILYNRWARFAGYGQIALIARGPPLIDIGEALLQITGDSFKVILCR